MSYCVNCGVELADSEKRCPLCQVEVVNPLKPYNENSIRPYPQQMEQITKRIDRRFTAALLSAILMIPVLVTLLVDLLVNNGTVTWSIYPVGGIVLLFILVVLPLYWKKANLYLCELIDCTAIVLFLWGIDAVNEGRTWSIHLGIPITLLFFAVLILYSYLFRNRLRSFWTRGAAVFLAAGFYPVLVELLVNLFLQQPLIPKWSGFVLIPCGVLATILLILRAKKRLREEIQRRMFI